MKLIVQIVLGIILSTILIPLAIFFVLALIIFLPQPALYMLLIAGVAAPLVMSFLRHRRAELDAGRPELDAAR